MFYEGDLQSGIADAIKQAKLVACFVRDDDEESAIWEDDYLRDFSVSTLLQQKTILLRIQAGSQEARYLAAVYPLPKSPALVIIQSNGQLKEYLAAGVIKSNFLNRIKAALQDAPVGHNSSAELTSLPEDAVPQNLELTSSSNDPAIGNERRRVAGDSPPEQLAHAENKTEEQEAAEGPERCTKAAVRKEMPKGPVLPDPKNTADMKYALMQKKRREDARKDRERILKKVEDDKIERRKAREALQRATVQVVLNPDEFAASKSPEKNSTTIRQQTSIYATQCALQVRLFDGSTIKSRFQPTDTLGNQVRSWVDSQRVDSQSPYTFKQILNPQPNRTVTISEEEESLQSLGLTPSATFVLVAIKDYTSAYDGENGGYLSRMVSAGFIAVSYGINLVTGTLPSFFGGVAATRPGAEQGNIPLFAGTAITNVRTLEDSHTLSEENQLYNGNTLNFEPRRDKDSEE